MSSCSGLRRLVLFSLATVFLSCVPDTDFEKKFHNKRGVEYTLLGIGNVRGINARFNDSENQVFYDGDKVLVPIKEGTNSLWAEAYNQWGKDPTPAEDSFVSLNEEEARTTIEEIFVEKGYHLVERIQDMTEGCIIRDALFSLGAEKTFLVDYWGIKPGEGTISKDFVVNYVGYGDDLEEEILNKELLDMYGIPNCYIFRSPIEEAVLNNVLN